MRACALSDIPEEGAHRVVLNGIPICLARSQGEVFAINDVCSHADVSLAEGDVEDGSVECWLHGSRFDLRTGKPTSLPAVKAVATYPVFIEGDDVLVQLHINAMEK
jgi:3-phenylpropionate/trans-cinnamate dioxygenase ferredoxin subunit